jgi:hypothetical protein
LYSLYLLHRPEDGDTETPEQHEEKVPEEEPEEVGEDGEKGPVDYNALDYETMDGGGSDKDEDRFGKNGTTAVIEKPESEVAPTGNGVIEEELVTEIMKEKVQGKLLTVYSEPYVL